MIISSDWQPSATITTLRERAAIINKIRAFFAERHVLEVETPIMGKATGTDPYIESIPALFSSFGDVKPVTCYLQTSPEFAMKRLLAAGSGPIYQMMKVFRNGEIGQYHNPEFTMLEWYRPQFDHHQLMAEVEALLIAILACESAEKLTYRELFQRYARFDPMTTSIAELQEYVEQQGLQADLVLNHDGWLQLIMTHFIEPQLGYNVPTFVYDFPASQASLARISSDNPLVAERFEVYVQGIELANGFHELLDADEQRQRFMKDLTRRQSENQMLPPMDELFLAALKQGLPPCAGVALGVDRLIMLALKKPSIQEVISFDFTRV